MRILINEGCTLAGNAVTLQSLMDFLYEEDKKDFIYGSRLFGGYTCFC